VCRVFDFGSGACAGYDRWRHTTAGSADACTGQPASSGRGHSEADPARTQDNPTAGASQEEDRAAGAPAFPRSTGPTRRSNRAGHGRHRHRHRPDVPGAGQLDSDQQVPWRCRPGLRKRHRSREAAVRAGAALADGAERAHQRRAGQHLSARSAVPQLRGFACKRCSAGHRRLSERRTHQREPRRHRQLDFLPDSAIEGITIVGANSVFGLNALGGAVTILMRDGFNFQGTEIDARAGILWTSSR
jgi:hypothetical protein